MSEPSTLPEELLRRATAPLGVIDVRGPRARHERAKALLRRHVSPVAHTFTRAGADAPAAAATGLVLVNPPVDQPLESHRADSPGPLAPVRTADPAPVTQRAVVTNPPARSGDHEQVALIPLRRVEYPSIGHVRPDETVASIPRAAAVATPTAPSPLPLSAGVPFFTPAATPTALGDYADGVSRGHNQSTATGATPIDREPARDAALRPTPGRRQQPGASKAGGDRRDPSRSLGPQSSRSDELPIRRARVAAATPNDEPVRPRIDVPVAAAAAEPPPVPLALNRSTTTEMPRAARGATDVTVDAAVPSPAAAPTTVQLQTSRPRAEAPATLVHRVPRAPIAAATAAVEPSTPSAAELPLHSVNTGRITAAIARTATAMTPPATIARASSERVAVTASVPAVTASDGDRRERAGGGSLSPDGMLSHMLRKIAIERERRGGGRWP